MPQPEKQQETALIRRCDICGSINAIDLDPSPQRWKELQHPDHTVLTLPHSEALKLWESASKCDHRKLIEEMRATISTLRNQTTLAQG